MVGAVGEEPEQARKAVGSSSRRKSSTPQHQPYRQIGWPEAQHEFFSLSDAASIHNQIFPTSSVLYRSDPSRRRLSTSSDQSLPHTTTSRTQHDRVKHEFEIHQGGDQHLGSSLCSQPLSQASLTSVNFKRILEDEWAVVPREMPISCSTTDESVWPPSYNFPGTWDAAIHETTNALGHVGIASQSYAIALSQSGIGKASRSIGSALLSSTNKGALCVAGWAMEKTGAVPHDLPSPVQAWLRNKDIVGKGRWRAKQAAERRRAQPNRRAMASTGYQPGMNAELFTDEGGSFTLETYETDGSGDFVGSAPVEISQKIVVRETEWMEQPVEGVPTTFSPAALGEAMEEFEGDEGEEFEVEGDGLVRMFQFDDETV